MTVVLGVDGGASKTDALVVDQRGQVLGAGRAGCGNHQTAGMDPALGQIEQAAQQALAGAGVAPAEVARACFCLAGADLPADYAMLTEAMGALGLAQALEVKNDTMAALRAGLSRPWGVAVICGTGFNAAGRGRDGRELILPGLGWISGDWGGGGTLAKEVVRLVMRAWDGRGAPTDLTRPVLETLGVPSQAELVRRLYHGEIHFRELLPLVPLLFDAAATGDRPAQELVVRMGREVATTATMLLRRLDLLEAEGVEVVLAGGVFKGTGTLLLDTVRAGVQEEAPGAMLVRLEQPPVVGAALLALEGAGVAVDGAVHERLIRGTRLMRVYNVTRQ